MGFFDDESCIIAELTPDVILNSADFICSKDNDINDFFHNEAHLYSQQLLGKSYCFLQPTTPQNIVAAFTVSNSSIRVFELEKSRKRKLDRDVPYVKRHNQYPALLIGQLAVFDSFSHKGIGDEVLNFIKSWVIGTENKIACRYLVVDAINTPKVIEFYQRNGFEYLFTTEEEEDKVLRPYATKEEQGKPIRRKTRLMFFDLIVLRS